MYMSVECESEPYTHESEDIAGPHVPNLMDG